MTPPHSLNPLDPEPRRSRAPIWIVLLALAASGAYFFFFTKKKLERAEDVEPAPQAEKAAAKAESAPAGTPAPRTPKTAETAPAKSATTPAATATAPPKMAEPAPQTSFGFARPLDLGKQMAQSLAAGDFATVGKLAAASDPAQAADAAKLFEQLKGMGFTPGTPEQVELLGIVENHTRLAIPLMKSGSTTPLRLQLDLERDERMGWKIAKITLPKEASAALAAAAATNPAATPAASAVAATAPGTAPVPAMPAPAPVKKQLFAIEEEQDALSFAADFVKHLLNHDFASAQRYVDGKKVPVERLAGLCIVFEEGQYRLKPSKPLMITVANPEVSWVIAQVESESLAQSTEFGLELKRASASEPWKVAGVNLSQILGSFAQNAGKLGIPYTPIVQNPRGGESLALYFEYDQAVLHPRAKKQIEIIASIMKADPGKKLQIAGHTDALGDDSYNVRLSRTRADSVKALLVSLGVPEPQIETVGLGKAQPLSPNQKADGTDDPEGRSHNRRAEIFLDF